MAMQFPKTAVLSLEIAYKNNPRDKEIGMLLGEALVATGQIQNHPIVLSSKMRFIEMIRQVAFCYSDHSMDWRIFTKLLSHMEFFNLKILDQNVV